MSVSMFLYRFGKTLILLVALVGWTVGQIGCRGGLEPQEKSNVDGGSNKNTNSTNGNGNSTNTNSTNGNGNSTNTNSTNGNGNSTNTNSTNGNGNSTNTNNNTNSNNNSKQPPKKVSVQDIQDPKSPNHVSKGGGVILKGVIVTSPMFQVKKDVLQGFFVADPSFPAKYGGVMVVVGISDLKTLKIGDEVDIEGFADEFGAPGAQAGNTQINAQASRGGFVTPTNKNKAGDIKATEVKPEDIPAAPASKDKPDASKAEPYEGMLVEVKNVTVEEGTSAQSFGAWKLQGGVLVDDTIWRGYRPKKGDKLAFVRGVLHYSFDQYRLLPRSYKDVAGAKAECSATKSCSAGKRCDKDLGACYWIRCSADKDCNTGEKCDTATKRCNKPRVTTTIKQIQDPKDPNYIKTGSPVELKGVLVTTTLFKVSKNLVGFVVTDPKNQGKFGGILVVISKDWKETVAIGDEVDIKGKAAEYYNSTQITVDIKGTVESIKKTGNNKKGELKPVLVTPADIPSKPADKNNPDTSKTEPYESVLVELKNVTVDDVPNKYGEFTVCGGLLSVDDLLYKHTPAKGDTLSVLRGVIYFSFGNYKLLPRSADDVKK